MREIKPLAGQAVQHRCQLLAIQRLMQRKVLKSLHLDHNYIFVLLRTEIFRHCPCRLAAVRISGLQRVNLGNRLPDIPGADEAVVLLGFHRREHLIVQKPGALRLHQLIGNTAGRMNRVGR
ncbi:hypothetical protein D3C74_363440 [compost metagenome]